MSKELTHVQFLREYADCLDKGIKPSDKYQYLNNYQQWTDISMDILEMGSKFRKKPKPLIINGVECPSPLTSMPDYGVVYYVPALSIEQGFSIRTCTQSRDDMICLTRGIMYKTRQDVQFVLAQLLKCLDTNND